MLWLDLAEGLPVSPYKYKNYSFTFTHVDIISGEAVKGERYLGNILSSVIHWLESHINLLHTCVIYIRDPLNCAHLMVWFTLSCDDFDGCRYFCVARIPRKCRCFGGIPHSHMRVRVRVLLYVPGVKFPPAGAGIQQNSGVTSLAVREKQEGLGGAGQGLSQLTCDISLVPWSGPDIIRVYPIMQAESIVDH